VFHVSRHHGLRALQVGGEGPCDEHIPISVAALVVVRHPLSSYVARAHKENWVWLR
jgi:hypothetical protein